MYTFEKKCCLSHFNMWQSWREFVVTHGPRSLTRSSSPAVVVFGLALDHRNITASTLYTHLESPTPLQHFSNHTLSSDSSAQASSAIMVQTTGMLGEGMHIHELMMGK